MESEDHRWEPTPQQRRVYAGIPLIQGFPGAMPTLASPEYLDALTRAVAGVARRKQQDASRCESGGERPRERR